MVDITGSTQNDGRYTILNFDSTFIEIVERPGFNAEAAAAPVFIDTDFNFSTFTERGVVRSAVYSQASRKAERKTTAVDPPVGP